MLLLLLSQEDICLGDVLPHCSAAVHSGSYEVTMEVMRAGVPSVIFPVPLGDQLFWTNRAVSLGVALGSCFTVKYLSTDTLESQLSRLIKSSGRGGGISYVQKAKEVADRCRAWESDHGGNGLNNTVLWLEKALAGRFSFLQMVKSKQQDSLLTAFFKNHFL